MTKKKTLADELVFLIRKENKEVLKKVEKDRILAKQCLEFKGFRCKNQDCKNEACPLNKKAK